MSHGSGEEENYWPGYVDALTSMVQVLAFVMMLLAMAVFVLSQSVSKSAVEEIAKAAKVDAPPNATVAELTKIVIDQLEKAKNQPPPKSEPSPDDGKPAPPKGSAETPAEKVGKPPPESSSDDKPAAPSSDVPNDNQASTTSMRIVQTHAPTEKSQPKPSGQSFVIPFGPQEFKIPPGEDAKLDEYLAANKAIERGAVIVVRAYASSADGALSEARHLAYYRAMQVRKMLTDHKAVAQAIRVLITDTQDKAQGATADIFTTDETIKP